MVVSVDDKARLLRNKGDTTEAVDDAKSVVVVVLGKSMEDGECIMGKAKAREERCIIMTLLMKSERSGCLPELCWYHTITPPTYHTTIPPYLLVEKERLVRLPLSCAGL